MRREDEEVLAAIEARRMEAEAELEREWATTSRSNVVTLPVEHVARPLVDPESIRLGALGWLDAEPPPVDWLIPEVLQMGEVGVIAGSGGTGKTWLLLQLAVAVATGTAICPGEGGGIWAPPRARRVLVLNAEESAVDLRRRLWRIIGAGRYGADALAVLGQNLFVHSMRGGNNTLLYMDPRTRLYQPRAVADQVAALIGAIGDVGLVVIEPISRYRADEENNNEAATQMVAWLERTAQEAGSTILTGAHMAKAERAAETLEANLIRGASGLKDGVRWAMAMRRMTEQERKGFSSVTTEEAKRLVQVALVKSNNTPEHDPVWLGRGDGGVLGRAELQLSERHLRDAEFDRVVAQIAKVIRQHQGPALSAREMERDYVRRGGGMIDCSQKRLRPIIQEAVQKGMIIRINDRLYLPGALPT